MQTEKRPCRIKMYQWNAETKKHEKVEVQNCTFHQWGTSVDAQGHGQAESVAIVETQTGAVVMVTPDNVHFTDRGTDEG